jgi:hypothetical protein
VDEEAVSGAEFFTSLLPSFFGQIAAVMHGEGQKIECNEQA